MQHKGKRAVIDLDDTLSNFREEVMVEFNAITGKNRHWSEWDVLRVEYLYDVDDFLGVAYERKLSERSRPYPETVSFMHRLRDAGIHTTILTARGWHPRAEEITRSWLNLYGIPFDELQVCQLHECKSDYIRRMDKVFFTIDDAKSHCNKFNAMTENRPEFVFAYAQKWNEGVDDGVIRINNLHDVANYIEGL